MSKKLFWIFCLGVLLRLLLFFSEKSLWGDEWYSIELASMPIQKMFYVEIFTDTHPPLYPLLNAILGRLFGFTEPVFRSLSLIAGSGIVLASYWIGKELFGAKTGLVTSFFVSVSPYFLHLSTEIRSYSVLIFFSSWATVFFLKSVSQPQRILWKILYVAFAQAVVYTEHYGWFWLFGISMYLAYLLFADWARYRHMVWVQGIIFAIGLGSLATIYHHTLHTEQVLSRAKLMPYRDLSSVIKKAFGIYWRFTAGPAFSMLTVERVAALARSSAAFWTSFLVVVTSCMLVIRSLIQLVKTNRALFILFISTFIFPVIFLMVVYPIRLDARYLSWGVPLFMALLANSVTTLKQKMFSIVFLVFFSVNALASDIYIIRLSTDPIHKEDYPALVKYAFTQSGPSDAIGGLGLFSTYYVEKMGLKANGTYFHSRNDAIEASRTKTFDRIWIMYYIDMNPQVTEDLFRKLDRRLNPNGYYRTGNLLRFGGSDALSAMWVYERKR